MVMKINVFENCLQEKLRKKLWVFAICSLALLHLLLVNKKGENLDLSIEGNGKVFYQKRYVFDDKLN